MVNIVPGNRRRRQLEDAANGLGGPYHYTRVLADGGDDDGLGVDFEISSVDPCAGVQCGPNSDCNHKSGACVCDAGWLGVNCTVPAIQCNGTYVAAKNCTAQALAAAPVYTPPPTLSPTLEPTAAPAPVPAPGPSSSSGSGSGSAPAPAPVPASGPSAGNMPTQFTELVSVVSTLTTASETGTLDIGVPVTSLAVTLPPDVCGVAGGDGTSCVDACGVTQGDNSTCTDTCGILHGDGSSCVQLQGSFFACDHSDSKTGVRNDRQAVILRSTGADGLTGTYRLEFNGRVTHALTIHSSAEDVKLKLGELDTIGLLEVNQNITTAKTSTGSIAVTGIDLHLEFDRTGGTFPQHLGAMPLVSLHTESLVGLGYSHVAHACEGVGRSGYTLAEQSIVLTTDAYVGGGDATRRHRL